MSLFREESATLSDREITKTARPPCEPTSNQRESDLVLAALASEEVGRLQLRQLWKPLEGGAAAENGVDEGAHRARLEPSLAAALARATAALQRGEAPPPPGLDGDEGGERGLLQPKGGEEVCLPLGAHAAKRDGVVAVPPRQSTDLGGTALAARLQEQRHDAERLGLDSVAKQRQALVCELVECHRRRLARPVRLREGGHRLQVLLLGLSTHRRLHRRAQRAGPLPGSGLRREVEAARLARRADKDGSAGRHLLDAKSCGRASCVPPSRHGEEGGGLSAALLEAHGGGGVPRGRLAAARVAISAEQHQHLGDTIVVEVELRIDIAVADHWRERRWALGRGLLFAGGGLLLAGGGSGE
mmetsp:Transcript_22032/g.70972  ORF Transcript_22032/g.70972 Transcript_22032/m.70972 type:complete len:358 (+) Transcript_22032:504-1577(+)